MAVVGPSGLIGGALALGLIVGGTWWFGGILDAKDEVLGDWPHIHPELRKGKPAGKCGGVASGGQRASVTNFKQRIQTNSNDIQTRPATTGQVAK